MRLVACTDCHAQFDVTDVAEQQFRCHCGTTVHNVTHAAIDAQIRRCASCGAALVPDQEQCDFCDSTIVRDRGGLSLICPECLARNADDAGFCTHCGVQFKPQSVVDIGEERTCPACDDPMTARGIGGIRVHECTRCHGLWLPGASFDTLVEQAIDAQHTRPAAGLGRQEGRHAGRAPFSSKVEYRRCPVCDSPMHRKNFGRRSGVIVDWCRSHGSWLDADELEAIAAFILGGGLQRAAGERAGAAPGTARAPVLGARQLEALLMAERRTADGRPGGQRRVSWRHAGPRPWRQTLGDLFETLLGS